MLYAFETFQLTINYDKDPVLWDLNIQIPPGLLVAIVGPNGAGKSTLIKAAMGLLRPLSGSVNFFGKSLNAMRQKVAYIPQRETVDWDFPITVKELVLMGRYGQLGLFRRPRAADREAAAHYLTTVGMQEYGNKQISQLSGGQQQRAFVARALMQEADLYFMDEPFTGIDHASEKMLMTLLKQMVASGKTVFVVHHDLNTVEGNYDWMILLNMRLIGYGAVADTFTPNMLNLAYGKSYALFDEAIKLSQQKTRI